MKTGYLDIGNSFAKLAFRQEDEWNVTLQAPVSDPHLLGEEIAANADLEELVTGSVRGDVLAGVRSALPGVTFDTLKADRIPAEYLDYQTPESLGIDRFLVCLGARRHAPGNVIVIDAGSACTIDLMTGEDIFRGGVIMPGLKLFHRAMNAELPELPEVKAAFPVTWPGKSTDQSLRWGINGAFVMAVESFVQKFVTETGPASVFVTGGDAAILIKNSEMLPDLQHHSGLIFDGMESFRERWPDTA
jgi:type III pantothenate kinase